MLHDEIHAEIVELKDRIIGVLIDADQSIEGAEIVLTMLKQSKPHIYTLAFTLAVEDLMLENIPH